MVSKLTTAGLAVFAFSLLVTADVPAWGQCGGNSWGGETTCVAGYTCVASSQWYSQCIPGTTPTTSTSTSSTKIGTTARSTTLSTIKTATPVVTTSRTTTPVVTTSRTTTPVMVTTSRTTAAVTTSSSPVTPPPSDAIFVAVTGSDSGTGSITSPLKSIQLAVDRATAGTTIFLRGGTFKPAKNIQFAKSGTSAKPITVSSYQNEKVIIDGEALTGTPAPLDGALSNPDRGIFHIQNANYWRFIALEFINGPYGVYARDASNNYYERISTHDNYETGFQLEGASANNQVLYLDSYNNRDPRKNGESADGIGVKSGSGTGNIIKGARLWNNVDDGLDFYDFGSAITVEDTISWGNGVNRWGFSPFEGDGNGFKFAVKGTRFGAHIIKNSIAFANAVDGFVDNGNTLTLTMTRNTAFNNGRHGFRFQTSTSVFTNNIAASNKGNPTEFAGSQKQTGNSWQVGGTWNNAAFKSVDTSTVTGPRQANGKVVPSDFLIPNNGAALGATTYW